MISYPLLMSFILPFLFIKLLIDLISKSLQDTIVSLGRRALTSLYNSILNNSDNNDNITIDDYDLEKAIQESLNQYNLENKNTVLPLINSDEEHNKKEQESEFKHQTQITEIDLKRKNLLPIFKSKMHRLIFFDKEFKEIYELIKPIIDSYETSDLNYHETDNVTYDKIFNTLRSLRIPKEEWNILKTIFVKEVN